MKNKNFCVALYHPYKNDINGEFDDIKFQLECTKDGLSKLKTDDDLELIKSLTKKYTVDEVSKMLNIGRTTIKKYKDTIVPKKVYQYGLNNELIKIWNSTTEITDNTKYNKNTIKNACNGNAGRAKNIAYNYKWVYEKLRLRKKTRNCYKK